MASPKRTLRSARRPWHHLLAAAAVGWLAGGSPSAAQDQAQPEAAAVDEAASIRRLPPIDRFHAMLERPLFAASRRPAAPVEIPGEATDLPEEVIVDSGPAPVGAPEVRFVGTVGQNGIMSALVLRGDATEVERLLVGDEVDAWLVTQITASQLVMEHEGEQLVLNILQ